MKILSSLLIVFMLFSTNILAKKPKKVAKVKMGRGKFYKVTKSGKKKKLKVGSWIREGQRVKTSKKSFVRLLFVDKSVMNLGPDSEIDVKKYNKKDPGLIKVLKGSLRAKITKQPDQSGKSKLYITSDSAAMGIRGTEFETGVGAGGKMYAVTFEGDIRMAPMDSNLNYGNMENKLNSSDAMNVRVGQYIGFKDNKITAPVQVNPSQLAARMKNDSLEAPKKNHADAAEAKRSLVPPGVNRSAVMVGNSESIEKSIAAAAPIGNEIIQEAKQEINQENQSIPKPELASPEGEKISDNIASPVAGGYVDYKTGTYIPAPPVGAVYDDNTHTYSPPGTMGTYDKETGEFLPPTGVVLNNDGAFVSETNPTQIVAQLPEIGQDVHVNDAPTNLNEDVAPVIAASPGEPGVSGQDPNGLPPVGSNPYGPAPGDQPPGSDGQSPGDGDLAYEPGSCDDPCFCGIGDPVSCGGQFGDTFGGDADDPVDSTTQVNFTITVN